MKRILQFLIIVLITSSCKKDNTHSDLIIESFPMEIGTTWVYNWDFITKHYDKENPNLLVSIDTVRRVTTNWIEKDTMLFDTLAVKIFKHSSTGYYSYADYKTFRYADNTGLWYVRLPNGKYPSSFLKMIALPLKLNSNWYGYENDKNSYTKVNGEDTFEFNGYTYNCLKVKPEPLGMNYWYSEIGCIKQYNKSEKQLSSLPSYGSDYIDDKALLETHPIQRETIVTLVDFYKK